MISPVLRTWLWRGCGLFLAVPLLLLASGQVWAGSVAGSTAGTSAGSASGGTSASSDSTSGDDKLIVEARADAALFIASDGAIRGARLEAALQRLRTQDAGAADRDDLELARRILAQ